jgi:fatty-acyl-CoA synthase
MKQTLISLLRAGGHASRGAPALIERRGTDYIAVSYDELLAESAAAARLLAGAGVGEGDVLGVWLPNSVDYLAVEFATAALGAAVLGINTRYGVFELSHLMVTGQMKAIVLPAGFLDLDFKGRLVAAFASAREAAPDLPAPVILVAGAGDAELCGFDLGAGAHLLTLHIQAPPLVDAGRPEAAVNYFTTSGSTGAPKLAGHDQASVVIHSPLAAAVFDINPGDVVLGVLPFCGVFGFNAVMCCLSVGATCLVDPVFDAKTVLAAMARFGVTQAFGGDDLMGRLAEAWRENPVAIPTWRRGVIAQFEGRAEPLAAWARETFGAELTGVYGSSELMAFVSNRPIQADLADQVKGGGRILSDQMQFRVVDPETGERLGVGAQGELQMKGYHRLLHYLGNPAATEKAITADGFYRTGDLAIDEGDGVFTFVCRNTEALRLRGFLVEPGEIEQFLLAQPGVVAARVVGVRKDHGDVPVGFVTVADKALTGAALLKACKGELAAFKMPARIEVLEAFPVTAGTNGAKIKIEELKRMAAQLV